MGTMASQITSLTIVYSTVYSGTDERKHQTSTSLAFVRGIHRWRVNSPHKGQWRGNLFHLMTSSRKWDTLHLWANEFVIHYGIFRSPYRACYKAFSTFLQNTPKRHSHTWESCRCPNSVSHDDVIKWKHFPRYWLFVRRIHRSPVNSSPKSQWRLTSLISLICTWTHGWVNNRGTGDLRRYRCHYDITVMRASYLSRCNLYTLVFLKSPVT